MLLSPRGVALLRSIEALSERFSLVRDFVYFLA